MRGHASEEITADDQLRPECTLNKKQSYETDP